jgi:Fe-S cluster biosynthesis and repair protein YggX
MFRPRPIRNRQSQIDNRLTHALPRCGTDFMTMLLGHSRFKPETRNCCKELKMADNIKCKHCGEKRPALGFAPLPNELGQRIATEICQPCWAGWLQKQTQIINHYGLDLTNPDAQNFLFDNIKGYLFNESLPVAEQAQIDTTKEGSVKW